MGGGFGIVQAAVRVGQRDLQVARQFAQAIAGSAGQQDRGKLKRVLHGAMKVDAADLQETDVEGRIVCDYVVDVGRDKGQQVRRHSLERGRARDVDVANAGQLLDAQRDWALGVDEGDKAFQHANAGDVGPGAGEAHCADFNDGVAIGVETGRFKVNGDVNPLGCQMVRLLGLDSGSAENQ